MSSKAARSLNAVQAARTSVAEKVRRNPGSVSGKQGGSKQRSKTQPRPKAEGPSGPPNRTTPGKQKVSPAGAAATRSTNVVVARVDPVSVLKLSALFYLSLSLALFIAGVLLWTAARAVGLIANIEALVADVGFTDFRLQANQLLGASALASVVMVVAGSVANLLMALLYNLIGDTVGGLKVVLVQSREKPKG